MKQQFTQNVKEDGNTTVRMSRETKSARAMTIQGLASTILKTYSEAVHSERRGTADTD